MKTAIPSLSIILKPSFNILNLIYYARNEKRLLINIDFFVPDLKIKFCQIIRFLLIIAAIFILAIVAQYDDHFS